MLFLKRGQGMRKKKAVIIGSGIGGSGIAALLAHSGDYEVDLYERNKLIGGRFASYDKDGFRLDIGCHMIMNGEKGTLGEILEIVGQPDAVKYNHRGLSDAVFNYRGTDLFRLHPCRLGDARHRGRVGCGQCPAAFQDACVWFGNNIGYGCS